MVLQQQQTTKPALLTPQQIKRDLNRKPPSVGGSTSTSSHLTRTRQQGLALILLHKELQGILKLVSSDNPVQKIKVEKELAQVETALVKAAVGIAEEVGQEKEEGKGVGFRMEEALEDEEEGEEEGEEDGGKKKKGIKERYFALLSNHKVLPATIPIPSTSTTTTTTSSSSSSDESDHQAMRDIERDSLIVNGVPYQPGNVGGYQQVLTWLKEVMKQQLQAVKPSPLPSQSSSAASKKSKKEEQQQQHEEDLRLETFTKAILKQANRTNSAGMCFDILTQRLGVENVTTVVPDSKAAEPLLVDVDVGVFPLLSPPLPPSPAGAGANGWGWGLRAKVRAATAYVIYDEPCEEQWVCARAEYKENLCLPLLGGKGGGGGRGGGGGGQHFSLGASVVLTEKK